MALLAYAIIRTKIYERSESAFINSNLAKLRFAAEASAESSRPLTALITGANSGIGKQLAILLAQQGVRVILGCRNASRGKEAVELVKSKAPGADVRLCLIDVSEPKSVLDAAERLRRDASTGLGPAGHLDFLLLNAGIMPVSKYRWSVGIQAVLRGASGILHFLETSRAVRGGKSFLAQPIDDVGAAGCPVMLATHVLGHLQLVQELQPLMGPLQSTPGLNSSDAGAGAMSSKHDNRIGRVIWTGSTAADRANFDWGQLQPPAQAGQPSGFQDQLKARSVRLIDTYAQAKYAQDLLNVSGIQDVRKPVCVSRLQRVAAALSSSLTMSFTSLDTPSSNPQAALARRIINPTTVICPGFVDTELTPPFFKIGIPLFLATRAWCPSMNITGLRGTAAQVGAMVAPAGSLNPEEKWVLAEDKLAPAENGACHLPVEDQDRMWELCQQWLRVWKESVQQA